MTPRVHVVAGNYVSGRRLLHGLDLPPKRLQDAVIITHPDGARRLRLTYLPSEVEIHVTHDFPENPRASELRAILSGYLDDR